MDDEKNGPVMSRRRIRHRRKQPSPLCVMRKMIIGNLRRRRLPWMTISWPMISLRFRCRRRSLVRQSLYLLLPPRQTAVKAGHRAYGTLEDRSVLSAVCSRGGCIGSVRCTLLHPCLTAKRRMLNPGGTALTVGETKVSLGAYNYYYSRIVQNYLNYANYGYYDLDSTKDYSKQYVTNSDGEKITWLQMFKDKTVDQIQYVTSYYEAGQAAGITLTADQKKSIKEQMDSLKSSASEANQSLDDYIEKEFGDYCTAATLETVQEQAYIAENYYRHTLTRSNISDAEYNAFYKAHSKDYYNCAFAFIEMTYDTTSAETKAASVKKAKEYLTKIHSVKDMKR